MIDELVEDMGKRRQALKRELTQTVLDQGRKPAWPQPGTNACPIRSLDLPRSE